MQNIQQRVQHVLDKIHLAATQYQRSQQPIQLLAVSKTQPAERLLEAYQAGHRAFGENYLQEAREKQEALSALEIEWHFIGPIQSNKTREIAEHFQWVHSVDRLKIAKRLSEQRPKSLPPLSICLQVNIDNEASKSGVNLQALPQLAKEIEHLPNITLRGLMAIPAKKETFAAQRSTFARLTQARDQLQASIPSLTLDTLSMGMSDDLEAAIAEGATIVRVGSAIFGPRQYSTQ